MLNSFGDLRNHRYHGLFGAIIIEPPASQYYSNFGIRKENFSEQAVITAPGVKTFREFVLFAQNGIRLLDSKGNLIKTAQQTEESGHGEVDHEDTGEKGYNYRSERFFNRLKRVPVISKVFSSKSHGDPSTPLLQAYTGERVIIRYLMPADKPRNISFVLHGHNWLAQPDDPFSTRISVQGAVSVGGVYNIELENGAFYKFCKEAEEDNERPYFFIIDEINRGNLSKILGELMMLIEKDKRGEKIKLLYSNEWFTVPQNVRIIGMMNTADRSLALMDYALRRRFAFFDFAPAFSSEGFKNYLTEKNSPKLESLITAVESLNNTISSDESLGDGFRIGHSYFCTDDEITDEWLKSVVEYEVIPLIKEYWFDEPTKVRDWSATLRSAIK